MTPLDEAFAAMQADEGNDAARLRYYARLADGMLFMMLATEAQPGQGVIAPEVLELDSGPVVLAFDTEERLAEAAGGVVPYAELPGRVIAAQLAGQGVALGINLGVADSTFLVAPEALSWLADVLTHAPVEDAARPVSFHAPGGLPQALVAALDAKLARAAGLAQAALLAGVRYADGRQGHMLAVIGAAEGAETALARAIAEALTFSGVEAGEMDVTFLAVDAPVLARMARSALRFDLPQPEPARTPSPSAPGMDPEKPPRLR